MSHPPESSNDQPDRHRIFGVPRILSTRDASGLATTLEDLRADQLEQLPVELRPAEPEPDLRTDISWLRHWFDPTAKGERVRESLAVLPERRIFAPHLSDDIVLTFSGAAEDIAKGPRQRHLLTPEGLLVLHCLHQALDRLPQAPSPTGAVVQMSDEDIQDGLLVLAQVYREWTRKRVRQVVALLTSEPSTLRPAAAGLLLVLLINRNTAPERALPRPKNRSRLESISTALAQPALAYARTLSGSDRASVAGVDLYRGWALGELSRRLGTGLHSDLDVGIYLEPQSEAAALGRLVDDIRRRPLAARARVPQAVDAALQAYEAVQPVLAGLALAHERPSNTERIRTSLLSAAAEPGELRG